MRKSCNYQTDWEVTPIEKIELDLTSRDDIPCLLQGLQCIWKDKDVREQVLKEMEDVISESIDTNNGRPGMNYWEILVLGMIRLSLNIDYDRLQELANQHKTVREFLGHGISSPYYYTLQTVKNNVRLFTPEVLNKINDVVVKLGHQLLRVEDEELYTRCDSFVLETDVHFPTDINLLLDAMRKSIELVAKLCEKHNKPGWRQYKSSISRLKTLELAAQRSKRSKTKDREEKIKEAHKKYLHSCEKYLHRLKKTTNELKSIEKLTKADLLLLIEIEEFIKHAKRQIDQTNRRVIKDEKISHAEKVFSLFEPHTEWINKGKPGVLVELGVRVCIVEDQYQFILHHEVMQKKTDQQVATSIVEEVKNRFPSVASMSFDKGYFSIDNREKISKLIKVALPKKGKLSAKDKEIETSEDFINAKDKHSAVESAIHALEIHGLDRCLDHKIEGLERYVAMAILARNVHRIGEIIRNRERRLIMLRQARERKKCA